MKIPVFNFPWTCWKCGKEIVVTYPTTEDVYKTEFRGYLAPTYSNTRKENLIGNLCPFCKAYQGNYFVWDDGIMGNAYELEEHLIGFFNKVFYCINCGKEIELDNEEDFFTKSHIYEDHLEIEELSSSDKEEERKQRIDVLDSSVVCQHCLEIERSKRSNI